MLKMHTRPVPKGEPTLPTMYRFLRVLEESFTVIEHVRYPCCGAKRSMATLEPKDFERCLFCGAPSDDPRLAPLMQERDLAHCAFTKITRYVS